MCLRVFVCVPIRPVLTHTTAGMIAHVDQLLKIPGAYVMFGGRELNSHTIPDCYGMLSTIYVVELIVRRYLTARGQGCIKICGCPR